jgi:hypothetical protein
MQLQHCPECQLHHQSIYLWRQLPCQRELYQSSWCHDVQMGWKCSHILQSKRRVHKCRERLVLRKPCCRSPKRRRLDWMGFRRFVSHTSDHSRVSCSLIMLLDSQVSFHADLIGCRKMLRLTRTQRPSIQVCSSSFF